MHYLLQPCADYVQAAVETVVDIHREDVPGDVLVFLTGVVRVASWWVQCSMGGGGSWVGWGGGCLVGASL